MAGERDVVLDFPGIRERIPNTAKFVPELRRTIILQGCGHWIQEERAAEVNNPIIDFVRHLSLNDNPRQGATNDGFRRSAVAHVRG